MSPQAQEVEADGLTPKTEEVFLPESVQQELKEYAELKEHIEIIWQSALFAETSVAAIIIMQYGGVVSPAVPFFIVLSNLLLLRLLGGKLFFGKMVVTYLQMFAWLAYFLYLIVMRVM